MQTVTFTSDGNYSVVQARNPYGTHNLALIDVENQEAFRLGTLSVLAFAQKWMPARSVRKVFKHLSKKNSTRALLRAWQHNQ